MECVCSVVVPVYNEEAVLGETYKRLTAVMEATGISYEILFINDGSADKSAEIIIGFIKTDKNVRLINFSRNFGHQPAITAGMDYARGDAIVVIDADLQDPPEVIPEMLGKWKEGCDVVYGKRTSREGESFFKKISANVYYRFLRSMTSVDIPVDAGDFRLIGRRVADAMKRVNEKNRYMRGLISWVGFRQEYVEYARDKRFAGETKYPLSKMLTFAMNGVAAFSHKPLKAATSVGVFLSLFGFVYMIVAICQKLFTDTTIQGWTSLIILLLLTQGIILVVLGFMGEYIGRIYDEVKNRPIYIVAEEIENTGGTAKDTTGA